MGKFPLYTAIFSLLIIITAFVCLNTNNINYNDENIAVPEIITNKKKDKKPNGAEFANNEEENTPASTAVQKIESYIVKYDGEEVMLIISYENGKKISSPIPDIDIDYLTEIDRKHLFEGIKLENMEEVFKIIEDFSS